MRLLLVILLICTGTTVLSGVLDRSRSLFAVNEWPSTSDSGSFILNHSFYDSVKHQIDQTKCTVPNNLILNATGYLADGTLGCVIAEDDPAQAQRDCQTACSGTSGLSGSLDDAGPSVICWALKYPDGDCQGQLISDTPPQGAARVLGRCLCDVPALDYAINWFDTVAMPDLGQFLELALDVLCEGIWSIARDLLEEGIDAIPEIGPLTESAWTLIAGITGLTNKLNLTDIDIGNNFLDWLNPCGSNAAAEQEFFDLFDPIASVAAARGMPVGPKRPQVPPGFLSINPSALLSSVARVSSPSTPPSSRPPISLSTDSAASPASRPTETTPTPTPPPALSSLPSSPASAVATPSATKTCRFNKRDSGRKSSDVNWWYCDEHGITQMTSITSIIFGPTLSTVPRICSSKWSHACAHYSSVLSVSAAKGWDLITCSDFLGTHQTSRRRPAVTQWNKEHNADWVDPKWRREEECDRDEYPPVYFFQDDNAVLASTQQLVRLIPASQNRGAGIGLWGPFCWTEGLKDLNGYIPPMRADQPPDTMITDQEHQETIYMTYVAMAISFRPVFTISDWDNFGYLNMYDWGLAQNPCIPDGLVSDKYFPLLSGDPTLTTGPNQATWSYDYQDPPPQTVLNTAFTWYHD